MRSTDLDGNFLPQTQELEVVGPQPGRYLKTALERELEAALQQRMFERGSILPKVNEWVMDLFDEPNSRENMAAKTKMASQILTNHGFALPTVNLQVASEEARRAREEEAVKTIEVKEVSGEELVTKMMEAFKADEKSKAWREAERKRKGIDAPLGDDDAEEEIFDAPGEPHGS
jgi:hypothetical protein